MLSGNDLVDNHSEPASDDFTVGICATGDSPKLVGLATSLLEEADEWPGVLRRLVIVASAIPASVTANLRLLQQADHRLDLLVEEARLGKADAVNKIFARTRTPIVVMLNSDSVPDPGALAELLESARIDPTAGAISALPVTEKRRDTASLLAGFMWSAHNRCSIVLNHLGISNHSSDELVLFRSSAVARLPRGLVNDGAFLASVVKVKGYRVKVCQSARVLISTPRNVAGIVLQRRRILFGHAQVWHKTGVPPKTLESLLFISPAESIKILVYTLAREPRFLTILPLAFVGELAAAILSIVDTLRSTTRHVVWRRFP